MQSVIIFISGIVCFASYTSLHGNKAAVCLNLCTPFSRTIDICSLACVLPW